MKDRQVIVERAKLAPKQPAPKNVIIEYENKHRGVDRVVFDDGVIRADPFTHNRSRPMSRSNAEIRVVDRITDFSAANNTQATPRATTVHLHQESNYTPQEQANIERVMNYPTQQYKPKQAPKYQTAEPHGPTAFLGAYSTTYRSSYGSKCTP
jgi:hypothetical protein